VEPRQAATFARTARDAVAFTVARHQERVAAWARSEPGSWGYLAGQAVLACRKRLGRSLTEPERRVVWDLLWRTLLATRQGGAPSESD